MKEEKRNTNTERHIGDETEKRTRETQREEGVRIGEEPKET